MSIHMVSFSSFGILLLLAYCLQLTQEQCIYTGNFIVLLNTKIVVDLSTKLSIFGFFLWNYYLHVPYLYNLCYNFYLKFLTLSKYRDINPLITTFDISRYMYQYLTILYKPSLQNSTKSVKLIVHVGLQ